MVHSTSLFGQILGIFSRHEFQGAVRDLRAERYAKGFLCWDQFVAMLFCQLAQANSLRDICGGLQSCLGKVLHLGMREAPKRSTLSYANSKRPWELYQAVFFQLLARCQQCAPKHKFRFHNKLYSLDASVIDLALSLFDWARYSQTKGAVKLHLLLDHDGHLPTYACLTEGNVPDLAVARQLDFAPDSIVVFDRGYVDYRLFGDWTARRVFFVTRMKTNATYTVVQINDVADGTDVRADLLIRLTSDDGLRDCPHLLRLVRYYDPQSGRTFAFLTNNLKLSAKTIAEIYRQRWQVELFFKALKQNLKVKTFVGTSANAVKIQIWTALIAILLLKFLQMQAQRGWHLSNLITLLRWNLFTYRNLWQWLNDPFQTPPGAPPVEQLRIDF